MARPSRPRTISLSPDADAALHHLLMVRGTQVVSAVFESLIHEEMGRLGFSLPPPEPQRDAMNVEILVGGRSLLSYFHDGKTFLEAPSQGAFTIRLTNRTSGRRVAVVTLDGKNVVDGKDGAFDGRGWLIEGFGATEIPGWYRGPNEVAAFEFVTPEASYAAQVGSGVTNVGMLGVAVFEEDAPVFRWQTPTTKGLVYGTHVSDNGPRCSVGGTVDIGSTLRGEGATKGGLLRNSDVGAGYGKAQSANIGTASFQRRASPAQVIEIRYGTRDQLRAWGVPVDVRTASAFPAEKGVPAPRGWVG